MKMADRIKTILVATDFSDTAASGIEWGGQIARAHGARLILFHAVWPASLTSPAPEYVPLPARFYEDMRTGVARELERSAASVRASGLEVETATSLGSAAEAVIEHVEKVGADLVIAGTRGLTGWKRLLLGSTATRLVRRSPCPVLSVHPEDTGRHRELRTVLVPTDFSEDAALAADAAVHLLAPDTKARIVLLHAYHVPTEYVAPLSVPVPLLLEDVVQVEAAAKVEMAETAARVRARGIAVETRVVEGYPPQVIVDQARELDADLIAMGTHGRSGVKRLIMGSTAERVLPAAPCPVLTVHREP